MQTDSRNYTVYMLTSPEGKVYIGLTSKPLEKRWGFQGTSYKYNKELYADISNFGWDKFGRYVVATKLDMNEGEDLEHYLIDEFKSTDPNKGYNKRNNRNYHATSGPESRLKISKANKGKCRMTEEQRENIIRAKKIYPHSISSETKKLMSEYM